MHTILEGIGIGLGIIAGVALFCLLAIFFQDFWPLKPWGWKPDQGDNP